MRLLNLTLLPFNSTMVRLKDEGAAKFLLKNSFQFHYGTIKRVIMQKITKVRKIFQFHYGTIKRILLIAGCCELPHFNSTIVRLKASSSSIFRLPSSFQFHYGTIKRTSARSAFNQFSYFNSTMVRLKEGVSAFLRESPTHFNSTMVRLKESLMKQTSSRTAFQFHYGTIKSLSAPPSIVGSHISIPLWYD